MAAAQYASIRDRVLAAVDKTFAETVEIKFLDGGKADPDRANTEVVAPLRTGNIAAKNLSGGVSQKWKAKVAAAGGTLSINRATYTGPKPQKGDKIKAIERQGKPFFEVLAIDDRSHTRLVLILGDA